MPANPKPAVDPRYGHQATGIVQALQATQARLMQVIAGQNQAVLTDGQGNCTEVSGANLFQIVFIGAVPGPSGSGGRPGVQITTGIAQGVAGRAVVYSGTALAPRTIPTGTIALTKGSTAATLASTITGVFVNGLLIGAMDPSDPASGLAAPAITPGTTMTISGTAVTLSQGALESGTFYCAAATFQLLS